MGGIFGIVNIPGGGFHGAEAGVRAVADSDAVLVARKSDVHTEPPHCSAIASAIP